MAPRVTPCTAIVLDAEIHDISSPGLEAVVRRFARVCRLIRVRFENLSDGSAGVCQPVSDGYAIALNPHACRWADAGRYTALGTHLRSLRERSPEEYQIEVLAKLLHELRHAWQYESGDPRWEQPVAWTTAEEPRYYYRADEVDARAYADKHVAAAWALYKANV